MYRVTHVISIILRRGLIKTVLRGGN